MTEDDRESVQENARKRQRERTEHVENMLSEASGILSEHKYPTTSEELATTYADQPIDLPNETESLGSVFRRLDERYETSEEAREALYNEVTGEAAGTEEYNDERPLDPLEDDDDHQPDHA